MKSSVREALLIAESGKSRFNPGLIKMGSGFLMTWRSGFVNCKKVTTVAELDQDFNVLSESELKFASEGESIICEDARLFRFGGEIWTAYTYMDKKCTCQKYGPLGGVEDYIATFDQSIAEKNLQFFTVNGKLYCIHSISPVHRVMEVFGNQTLSLTESKNEVDEWYLGEPRGGTPPVFHDGLFWSFFHSNLRRDWQKVYFGGCYAFKPFPPFEIVYMSKTPLLIPYSKGVTKHKQDHGWQQHMNVVFPSGLVIEEGGLIVAYGSNDCECRIARFSFKDVMKSF